MQPTNPRVSEAARKAPKKTGDPISRISREFGAGNEARTRDLNLGKVALYQLSYTRMVLLWRRDPESNRTNRICNPGHNRFAIAPP